ncbi:PaaI family thioesterase [Mangrovitalea sediminis]|uniref:PaaI family thioesterase n=1 Tax=Mangrovitalea sediminis TaxID=1982043 RepID=UPI000BE4E62B|nr:PaaI family thioesterase [Mangrovitalea sediminis]
MKKQSAQDDVLFGQVSRFIRSLRQSHLLGIEPVKAAENELILRLPYSESIVGDPETRIIHGGAITTLMDTASGSVIICALPEFELCPTLDLRVDYMRPAEPDKPVFARARAYRVTRNIVFTRCEAYQDDCETTVAHCVATFMRIGADASPKAYRELITGVNE